MRPKRMPNKSDARAANTYFPFSRFHLGDLDILVPSLNPTMEDTSTLLWDSYRKRNLAVSALHLVVQVTVSHLLRTPSGTHPDKCLLLPQFVRTSIGILRYPSALARIKNRDTHARCCWRVVAAQTFFCPGG